MVLGPFYVWGDERHWFHKMFSWKDLTLWGPVLLVFLEHKVPHSNLYLDFLSEYYRSVTTVLMTWSCRTEWWATFFWSYNHFPFKFLPNYGHFLTDLSHGTRNVHSKIKGKDFVGRPLHVLLLDQALLTVTQILHAVSYICYSLGNGSLWLLLPMSRVTVTDLTGLHNWSSHVIIITLIWGSVTHLVKQDTIIL